jgi:hypothetical protein
MRTSTGAQARGSPEQRVRRLVAQLRNQVLWDSLLIVSPPLLGSVYLAVYLYQAASITSATLLLLSGAALCTGLLGVVLRTFPLVPSATFAARLLDDKTAGQDRFLTLVTMDAARGAAAWVERLRSEVAALLERIDYRRAFPYRIKRSFYGSLLVSFIAVVLFHLFIPLVTSNVRQAPPQQRISEVAEKIARSPSLSALAQELHTLAVKLQQPNLSEQEKQALIQPIREQVEKQRKSEPEQESRALLGQALSTLKELEQQSPRSQEQDSEKGGGAQASLSQQGQREGRQSQDGGDSKGQLNASQNTGMQQAQAAQGGSPKEQGKETEPKDRHDGQSHQAQAEKAQKDAGMERAGKTQGGSQEKPGRSRSEEIPQGAPPVERFHKPGERGQEGVKSARYVQVQLPEDLVADSQGEGTMTKQSREAKAYPKAPVGNVPLPAHVPEAPAEKQQLPLEYRGIIR